MVCFVYSKKKKEFNKLQESIDKLNRTLERKQILELAELLGNRKELFLRNLFSGMFKGIGIGIGFTILTAILLIILQKIVALNIPVIGQWVADIIDIVKQSR